jgi:hypothetical protein
MMNYEHFCFLLVRQEGLEPTHPLQAMEPKSTAAAITPLAHEEWCRLSDSNRRPIAYKAIALPTELKRQFVLFSRKVGGVSANRFSSLSLPILRLLSCPSIKGAPLFIWLLRLGLNQRPVG